MPVLEDFCRFMTWLDVEGTRSRKVISFFANFIGGMEGLSLCNEQVDFLFIYVSL